jgi:ribose transport system ATP-binding protein
MTTENQTNGGRPIVEVVNVTKRFPGVTALKDVSVTIRPNEVLGLVGENGAGKSTLLKVLNGIERPDEGKVIVRGEEIRFRNVADAADHGIGMVFQEQSLIPTLTVGENIFLGNEGRSASFGVLKRRDLFERAAEELAAIGSPVDPKAQLSDLRFSQRQMVEIAKVLAIRERTHHEPVILLDEPTSVLEADEVERLFGIIEGLRTQASVVFISHRLDEVLHVSDRIYVMRDGEVVAERDPKQVDVTELHALMVGETHAGSYYNVEDQRPYGEQVVLSVRNLSLAGSFSDVSFDIHEGEVLTIAGVEGAGRDQLVRAIIGAFIPDSGEIHYQGKKVKYTSPAQAAAAGIGYVPSDRRGEGALMPMSVRANITMAYPEEVMTGPILDRGKETTLVKHWIDQLRIRTPGIETPMRNLSGGNQQKVVVAKWLISAGTKVLILATPTRGLDVGAKTEVHRLIRELAERGIAILMLADTLDEGIALSHTIMVMKDGEVTGRFDAPPDNKPTQVQILERMV